MQEQRTYRFIDIRRCMTAHTSVYIDQLTAIVWILSGDMQKLLDGLLIQPGHTEQGLEGPKLLVQIDGSHSVKWISHSVRFIFFTKIGKIKAVTVEFDDRVIVFQYVLELVQKKRLFGGCLSKQLCNHPAVCSGRLRFGIRAVRCTGIPCLFRAQFYSPADHVQLGCGCAKTGGFYIKINDPRGVQPYGGQISLLAGGAVLLMFHSTLL